MIFVLSKSRKTELYRKAVHLSSLWMPMFIAAAPRNWSIVLFGLLTLLDLAVEYTAWQKSTVIGVWFRRLFIKTLRSREIGRGEFVASGSVYVLAAAFAVSVCFSPKAAAAAMSVMLISDSCAALVGKFFGVFRFNNGKSAEGTLAFFISAAAVVSFFFPGISPLVAGNAALSATAVEFFEREIGIDDNLAIPLCAGFWLNLI